MGSKPKSTAPRTPVEDPNSLRSRAVGRVIDVIAEGPIAGLVDGLQSVYFDGTPVQNRDGSMNFTGMDITLRNGTPDQQYVPDFPAVESEVGVGTEVRSAQPVTRRVDNLTADAIRVTITTPALVFQDTVSGDTKGTKVEFIIRIRKAGRTDWDAQYPMAIEGKQTGEYQRQYRIPLPKGGPWDVQVAKITPDSDKATLQNSIYFTSYTEIIDHKLSYPNTAYIASKFHAEQFDSVPKRQFDIRGWIVKVPNNYDPINRTYAGIWSGEFKMAWTDNPAWIMYALLTHPRGAGLPESSVDRWGLYTVARYCDEFVDDGYGLKEPRFTANGVINTREEAFAVINTLASTFRGMAYWSAGAVSVVSDMPADPTVLVTPSNTIGGFSYSGVANKARHTACAVAFLDKTNNYERSIEVYEDIDAIERWGYNLQTLTGFATTSRGQAMRLAKWTVDTEVNAGDSLTYKASLDHLNVVPGSIVEVQDPTILGFRAGGRINHSLTNLLNIDDTVNLVSGVVYRVKVTMPDLRLEERLVINGPGPTSALQLNQPLPGVPLPGAEWVLLQNNLSNTRQFRVLGVTEDEGLEFTVTAISHDPFKFDRIEKGIIFKAPPFSTIPNPGFVTPPSNVRVERQYIASGTSWTTALQLSWDASPDAYVSGYRVAYRRDSNNFVTLPETTGNSITIYGESAGRFVFHVQAINYASTLSRPAILEVNILDSSPITMIRPSGLELEGQGGNNVFSGRDPKFAWRPTALRGAYPLGEEPAAGAGYLDAIFRDYEIRIYDTGGKLIHTDHTGLTWWTFTFEKNSATAGGPHRAFKIAVYMRDRWGNVSLPAELEVINPAPPQPVNLQVVPGLASIFISHDKPSDTDFAGDLIWMSATQGFEPSLATVVYDGPSTYNMIRGPESTTQFVRIASYDVFGKTGLNISPEFRIFIGGVSAPDQVPPAVPTGLRLSSRTQVSQDGAVTYRLRADWDASEADDLLQYKLEIAEDGGNFVFFTAPENTYEWVVQPGARYTVRLSAMDKDANISLYSFSETLLITPENAPKPADPTVLKITAAFRTLWLQWPQHPARDWEYMEVWEAEENDRSKAVHIHNATGTTFPRQGLPTDATRYYWIKAVTRSLATSEFFPASPTAGIQAKTTPLEEGDFPDGIIKSEFFDKIDAVQIEAGTTLSGTIKVDGTALSGIANAALDPAARLNAGTTTINPGNILIAGGTRLSDWRFGGDNTKIAGGALGANSITANKLTIGLRNVDFLGLSFEPVKESNPQQVRWTAGTAVWAGDSDQPFHSSQPISAGSANYNGKTLYFYWGRGMNFIGFSEDPNTAADPNVILLGTYTGGVGLYMTYGRTLIDGDTVRTGTVHADKLIANTVTARHVSASEKLIANQIQLGPGTINGQVHIENATIYSGQIKEMNFDRLIGGRLDAQFLQVGGGGYGDVRNSINIESRNGYNSLRYHDNNNIERVAIGRYIPFGASALSGIVVRDQFGKEIMTANGLGVQIADDNQLRGGSVVNVHHQPTSPRMSYRSAKSTQGITNKTLFTLRIDREKDNATQGQIFVGQLFRLNINGVDRFEWRGTNFPPNMYLDIAQDTDIFCKITVFWQFNDGTTGWLDPETLIGNDPVWLPSSRNQTYWTVLEVKR